MLETSKKNKLMWSEFYCNCAWYPQSIMSKSESISLEKSGLLENSKHEKLENGCRRASIKNKHLPRRTKKALLRLKRSWEQLEDSKVRIIWYSKRKFDLDTTFKNLIHQIPTDYEEILYMYSNSSQLVGINYILIVSFLWFDIR